MALQYAGEQALRGLALDGMIFLKYGPKYKQNINIPDWEKNPSIDEIRKFVAVLLEHRILRHENHNYIHPKERYHFFKYTGLDPEIKGDTLKRKILLRFADKLSSIHSNEEINIFRQNLSNSAGYKLLRQAQGIVTWLLNLVWHIKPTTSELVLNELVKIQQGFINSNNPAP